MKQGGDWAWLGGEASTCTMPTFDHVPCLSHSSSLAAFLTLRAENPLGWVVARTLRFQAVVHRAGPLSSPCPLAGSLQRAPRGLCSEGRGTRGC